MELLRAAYGKSLPYRMRSGAAICCRPYSAVGDVLSATSK
jgi:hypothetical protein